MKNIFNKLLFMMFVLILQIVSGFSFGLELISQEPKLVSPGEFVILNVQISTGSSDTSSDYNDLEIEFLEDEYFSLLDKNDKVKKIEFLSGSSNINLRYKIKLSKKIQTGLNDVSFKLNNNQGNIIYKLQILAKDSSPKLQLEDFNLEKNTPGSKSKYSFTLNNLNFVNLKNVFVSMDVKNIENKVIKINKDTNVKIIKNIDKKDKKKLFFDIIISPNALSKSYEIPIKVEFQDSLGTVYKQEFLPTINVYIKPEFVLKYNSYKENKLSFSIANNYVSQIKGLQIEVLENEDYEILENPYSYIGDLNADDFQTFQAKVKSNKEVFDLKLKLNYFDSYNKKFEETRTFKIKKVSIKENSNTKYIIVFIIIGIGIYYYRKKSTKKNKKN